MSDARRVVDVDAPGTWPADLRAHAEQVAADVRASTADRDDFQLEDDEDSRFRGLLSGWFVRAFHATRLLEHELDMIRESGLQVLTESLVEGRIESAYAAGCISKHLRDQLRNAHVFSPGAEYSGRRAGHVSLFLPERVLAQRPGGVRPLMTTWGGEGIYMTHAGAALRAELGELGTPSVVVTDVAISASWRAQSIYPSLDRLLVRRLLDLDDVGATLFNKESIPPEQIVGIWQPGMAEYDRYSDLPSS